MVNMNAAAEITADRPALTALAHALWSALDYGCDLADYSFDRAWEIFGLGREAAKLGDVAADLSALVADFYDAFMNREEEFAFLDARKRAERLYDAYSASLVMDREGQLCVFDGDDLWLADAAQIADLGVSA